MGVSVVGTIRGRRPSTLRTTACAPAPPWGEVGVPVRVGGSRHDLTHGPARVGAVVVGLGLGDVLPVSQGPVGQRPQQMRQARPHLGEPVVDLGGNRGVDRAVHQPVALQTPHRQGEHALGDAADGALQLTETQRTARQLHDDQQGPLVPQSVMNRPDAGILAVRLGLELCDRYT